MFIVLGSSGLQGESVIRFLLSNRSRNERPIVAVDINRPNNSLLRFFPSAFVCYQMKWEEFVLNESNKFKDVILISCLPPKANYGVAAKCSELGWNYIDLGGDVEITKEIYKNCMCNKLNSDCTFVPDCGLAPGIVSSFAGYADRNGKKELCVFCGGLPVYPRPPLFYVKSFSTEGLVREYTGTSEIRKDGKIKHVSTLSDNEFICFNDMSILEADYTSGATSLTCQLIDLPNFCYKTLRYPGHFDYLKKYNILCQPNVEEILDSMLIRVNESCPDFIILRVEMDKEARDYVWNYNYELNLSAMSQATGHIVGAVATMIEEKKIKKGFVGMHEIDVMEILRRVKK